MPTPKVRPAPVSVHCAALARGLPTWCLCQAGGCILRRIPDFGALPASPGLPGRLWWPSLIPVSLHLCLGVLPGYARLSWLSGLEMVTCPRVVALRRVCTENGLLPAVAYLSLTYDSDFCRNQGFGDGTMTWRAGRGTVSEQDYNSVVLIEKLHVRATARDTCGCLRALTSNRVCGLVWWLAQHAGSRSLWEGVWNGASVAVKRWRYPSKKNASRAAEGVFRCARGPSC